MNGTPRRACLSNQRACFGPIATEIARFNRFMRHSDKPLSGARLHTASPLPYWLSLAFPALITALPPLTGARWRMCKVWKSYGRLAQWADSHNRWRITREVYGKLSATGKRIVTNPANDQHKLPDDATRKAAQQLGCVEYSGGSS